MQEREREGVRVCGMEWELEQEREGIEVARVGKRSANVDSTRTGDEQFWTSITAYRRKLRNH